MKYYVAEANWHMHMAQLIDEASDGDVIVVSDEYMKELGEGAKSRMCPEKRINFEVKGAVDGEHVLLSV